MKHYILAAALTVAFSAGASAGPKSDVKLSLTAIGQHQTGTFNEGAAEIVAHDPRTQRLFAINASAATVDVLDIRDPANPVPVGNIDASKLGGSANSVAIYHGLVAVAIEAKTKTEPGVVAFYDAASLALLNSVSVGALPDMLTFAPNGRYVLVANEGEPNDDYDVDPEGSVSVIDLRKGVAKASVQTAGFRAFNGKEDKLRAKGVRIFGPNATAAQDLEPEYITVSDDSRRAWVSLQEANAIAVVDIQSAKVIDILPLGTKDHSLPGNELDVSDKDGGINIANWPIKGMYLPDAINSYKFRGKTLIVTANEGDSRDYDGYSEEARVKDLPLDPAAFPNASELRKDKNLGRLKVTTANGDANGDGLYETLYSFGARSFSIWDERGRQVYDSGSDFETITADALPNDFNSDNAENDSFDSRSDDKGPEPEGLVLGDIRGQTFAFVGLERVGGIMVYDVSDPNRVRYVTYINHRDFDVDAEVDGHTNPTVGDLGPEGLLFISADQSPTHKPLLVVGNEVSGTTTIFQIDVDSRHTH